jgi:hypothetical protein
MKFKEQEKTTAEEYLNIIVTGEGGEKKNPFSFIDRLVPDAFLNTNIKG